MGVLRIYPIPAAGDDGYWIGTTRTSGNSVIFGKVTTTLRRAFLRLPMDIPPASEITSATLSVLADANLSVALTANIQLVDSDNCGAIETWSGAVWIASLLSDPTPIEWTPDAWTSGLTYTSPDIASIVQGFINRSGYARGNYMGIGITQTSGTAATRSFASQDSGSTAAILSLRYKRWGNRWYKWAQARP